MGRTGRARRNGRGNVRDGVSKASRTANLTSRATEQLTGRAGWRDGRKSWRDGQAGRAEEQAEGRVSWRERGVGAGGRVSRRKGG